MAKTDLKKRLAVALGEDIRKRREDLGWSQAKLADVAETTQQTVDRIEKGETLHSRALDKIKVAVGIHIFKAHPDALNEALGDLGASTDRTTNQQRYRTAVGPAQTLGDLPVFAIEWPGSLGILVDSAVDYILAPASLQNASSAYAVIISESTMDPVFRLGDVALVNPNIPARENNEVILRKKHGDNDAVLVRTLVEVSKEQYVVKQWDPVKSQTLSRSEWHRCDVVIGKYSRL